MKLKRDTKFGEKLTCRFKNDIKNLTKFDVNTRKSRKLSFNGLLLSKVYIAGAKKYIEVIFDETKEGYKI